MSDVEINTGDIMKWADAMEKRGADFAAEVVKKAKGSLEQGRKSRVRKFKKIRRQQSGNRRFAIQKAPSKAELLPKSAGDHFKDIFKEK
jgi:hypothetical protein